MTYVDVWSIVALQERQVRGIEKLWRLNLIERSPKLTLLMAYYRVSNSMLKSLLKMKVRLHAFLIRKGNSRSLVMVKNALSLST